MTEFLVDIAYYQAGLSIAEVKKEGFAAVTARASTGYDGGTKDSQFANFKSQAKKAGILFAAYHFLYPADSVSVDHQANVCASAIGDTGIPVMIDHEPDGSSAPTPSVDTAVNFAKAMRDKGYRVPLWYLPHWVWQDHLGSPSLPKDAGLSLVSSSYVSGSGYASTLYPGDNGAGWDPYGGLTPVIWQFTDQAKVDGQLIDADAYRGSYAELKNLFHEGDDVPIYTSVSAQNVKLTAGENHNVAFTSAGAEGQWSPPNGKATAVGPGVFTGDITINATLPEGAELHYRFVETNPGNDYKQTKAHGVAEMRHGAGTDYSHDTTVSWVDDGMHLWVQLWCSKDVTLDRVGAKVALFR